MTDYRQALDNQLAELVEQAHLLDAWTPTVEQTFAAVAELPADRERRQWQADIARDLRIRALEKSVEGLQAAVVVLLGQ